MSHNSPNNPNNSILTFSPLLTTKKVKDHFQTPPNRLNKQSTTQSNLNSNLSKSPQNSRINPNLDDNSNISNHDLPLPNSANINNNTMNNLEASTIVDINNPLTQADKLRIWRHDALLQHHYKTAIYIGDKILSLTNDPNDAFWLAQVHYTSGNYQIARNLLSGPKFEASITCRYLTGLCLIKLEKFDEALDIVGEVNPFRNDHSTIRNNYNAGGIRLESSMCYLRGLIYSKQNNFEAAKNCFKEAVLVDVKCFEAFDELISNHLLTPDEEWDLLSLLNFDDTDNNNELVKMLYTIHLNKYKNLSLYKDAKQRLNDEYNLGDNIDILLSQAELYFIQCKFQDCLDLCKKIIDRDELNISALSNYLSCLYELGGKNELFLMAHKLAENYPNHYITWVAIGIYYFSIKQISEARIFFSKASILNSNFASAWIGFAHTFAADGEHEQAVSAYSTASRLFPGTHLPNLFLGMQYAQMNNYTLALEYLNYSFSICPTDPLLLNEIGVLHYHKNELQKAEYYLKKALYVSKFLEYGSKAWCSIHCNLAHVYRRMSFYDKAINHFNEVLKIAKKDVNIYSTLGLIHLKTGKITNAIEYLHIALSIQPNDSMATDLLDKALDLNIKVSNKKFLNEALNTHTVKNNNSNIFKINNDNHKSNTRNASVKYIQESNEDDEIMDIASE